MPDLLVTRTSNAKEVIDTEAHDGLLENYVKIIERLTAHFPVVTDSTFKELVNFKTNRNLPIHSWFDYKQGYADSLVERLLNLSKLKANDWVLDPFTGVGTTQVTAQQKSISSIGLDINPVAVFATKVKTHIYTSSQKRKIDETIKDIKSLYKKTTHVPRYKKLESIFTPNQLDQILSIKGFYESLNDEVISDFFKLAYLSIIESVSNRIKDGNGIKISKTKKVIQDVRSLFEMKCKQMLADIETTKPSANADIILGSILNDDVFNRLKDKTIGSVIYSPPYANCFDYLEVYKMEVWLGDFVKDYEDFAMYRSNALRSHVNSKFETDLRQNNSDVDVIASLVGTYNIWNKNIPAMLRGYFDDMTEVIKRTYQLSRPGALCAIVVANSGYKGVIVPTDLLLADIAKDVGYNVEEILFAREIRSSSQQMVELKNKGGLMRESIILLRK